MARPAATAPIVAGPGLHWKKLCRESTRNRVKPEARELVLRGDARTIRKLVLLDKQLAEEAQAASQQPPNEIAAVIGSTGLTGTGARPAMSVERPAASPGPVRITAGDRQAQELARRLLRQRPGLFEATDLAERVHEEHPGRASGRVPSVETLRRMVRQMQEAGEVVAVDKTARPRLALTDGR